MIFIENANNYNSLTIDKISKFDISPHGARNWLRPGACIGLERELAQQDVDSTLIDCTGCSNSLEWGFC